MTPSTSRCAASNASVTTRAGLRDLDPAIETYAPAMLRTGQPTGHSNDVFDAAAIIHVVDYQQ
jgi:hypothetical protein